MSVRQRQWKDAAGKTQTAWVVDIEFEHGDGRVTRVRKTSPVDTRRGAEQYEREIRNALLAGTWGVRRKEIPEFAAFAARWMDQTGAHNKGSSQKAQQDILNCHLLPAFTGTRLDQIDTATVDRLSAQLLAKKLSKKTVNNILACLSGLLSLAKEWNELPQVPTFHWLKAEKPGFDFLTFEEAAALHVCAEPGRWMNMIGLILNTGLRIGEVAGLQWKDIDLRGGTMIVRRRVYRGTLDTPKGGRERIIPLNDGARDVLAAVPRRLDIPWVFPQRDGQFIRHPEHATAIAIHRQVKRAGIERVITWHDLRHTFASHLVMRGVPLKVIQELLGHATIGVTERYAHLAPAVSNAAVKALDGHQSGDQHLGDALPYLLGPR